MLNGIYAAEVQYRHETARLDRELLQLADMAERGTEPAPRSRRWFRAAPATALAAALTGPAPVTARVAWPRPISEHGRLAATRRRRSPAADPGRSTDALDDPR